MIKTDIDLSVRPSENDGASGATTPVAVQRSEHIDFLKAVLILLMITFHLVYVEQCFPHAKTVVYAFHMPCFLLISGYLMNVQKPWRDFRRTLFRFLLPYVLVESAYIVAASVLPIREHIDQLTPAVFLDRLLLHPLGPYWYLHTLLICSLVRYFVCRFLPLKTFTGILLTAILYYLIASQLGLVTFSCALYFLAGAALRDSKLPFLQFFQSSALAVVAFALLVICGGQLDSAAITGVFAVYLAASSILWLSRYVTSRSRSILLYIGRNTLILFLFSPAFTILCKPLVPLFVFEPTGLLYLVISLALCTAGSLALGWLLDRLRLAPFMLGRDNALSA